MYKCGYLGRVRMGSERKRTNQENKYYKEWLMRKIMCPEAEATKEYD